MILVLMYVKTFKSDRRGCDTSTNVCQDIQYVDRSKSLYCYARVDLFSNKGGAVMAGLVVGFRTIYAISAYHH